MKDEITLADGTLMTWDQFSRLSNIEQSRLMKQATVSSDVTGRTIPRGELLPRIRAAAEGNKITEEDLLTFIKIMHDVFFQPAPTESAATPTQAHKLTNRQRVGRAFQPKPVRTPAGNFASIAAATRYHGAKAGHIRSLIKKGEEGYYFI